VSTYLAAVPGWERSTMLARLKVGVQKY